MKKLENFKKFEVKNLNAVSGGAWKFTGGTTGGHRDDMDVNGHVLCSNGDGTYSNCPIA